MLEIHGNFVTLLKATFFLKNILLLLHFYFNLINYDRYK